MRKHCLLLLMFLPSIFQAQNFIDTLRKQLAQPAPNDSLRVLQLIDLGIEYARVNLDSAFFYTAAGLKKARETGNPFLISCGLQSHGVCHYYRGEHTKAMEHYLQALEIRRRLGNERDVISTLSNVAIVQSETNQNREAVQTQFEILKTAEKIRDSLEIGKANLHLGSAYFAMFRYDSSILFLLRALDIFKKINLPMGQAIVLGNLSEVFTDKKDFENAEKYLRSAMLLNQQLGDKRNAAVHSSALGSLFLGQKKYAEAVEFFEQAIRFAHESGGQINVDKFYKSLSEAWHGMGNFQKAHEALLQYSAVHDSLSKAQFSAEMADFQTKYETEKKEATIREQALDLRRRQALMYTFLAGAVGLLALLWLTRRNYQHKQRLARQTEQLQQEKIERLETEQKVVALNAHLEGQKQERLRIAEDLHDDFGSGLSKISLLSEVAKRKTGTEQAIGELDKIAGASKELLLKMSEIVWALNHRNDTLASLAAYVRRYAGQFFEDSPVACHFNVPHDLPEIPLSGEQRRNLFLVVKESLHNVLKHAAASRVEIAISLKNSNLEIVIADNGKGFDASNPEKAGNGLRNMEKRMAACGGSFSVESQPGAGAKLRLGLKLS